MTYWVHGNDYSPVKERSLRGFRRYYVQVNGFQFEFSTLEELEVCRKTLGQKLLPPSYPNQHWLSRLPGWTKSWRFRSRAVHALETAHRLFRQTPPNKNEIAEDTEANDQTLRPDTLSVVRHRITKKKAWRSMLDGTPQPKRPRLKRLQSR